MDTVVLLPMCPGIESPYFIYYVVLKADAYFNNMVGSVMVFEDSINRFHSGIELMSDLY